MVFADLKNDYMFRRIFGEHADLLRRLLNDLLERTEADLIEHIERLPGEQFSPVEGGRLSIVDVRCRDRRGTTFVVEMQLIHHPGFISRVVYNACKAYARQLRQGEWYSDLTDVIAISICDFALWPDEDQDKAGLPRVPMLSRWNMTERSSRTNGILQVQYAFLELPKLPAERPKEEGANLWAWLFVNAPRLSEVPADLQPGPYREALELASTAKLTEEQLYSYEKMRDEIRQVIEIAKARFAEGEIKGRAEGERTGELKAKRETLLRLLTRAALTLTDEERSRIETCADTAVLDRWIDNVFGAKSAAEVLS